MSDEIDRFNKYKSMLEKAATQVIRAFLHIVRPTEGFPYHSNLDIERVWWAWKGEEENFYHMTGHAAPMRVFPPPPPEDDEHKPCRQMWGCLVQEQVEDQGFQGPLIKAAVEAIMASEACKSHSATCACKVPVNPWTWHECVAALEPLGLKHNPKCQCGGYRVCKQAVAAAPPVSAPYEYKHNVEECACGTCWKARVDSGTDDAYLEKCQRNTKLALERLKEKEVAPTGFGAALAKASAAISVAEAKSGGADKPEVAKELFAAMGTPQDSKCPHGLPFYACMSCSH